MTRSLIDPRTDAALATLDPARDAELDPRRYESTLARVLTVDRAGATTAYAGTTRPRRRGRRRLIAIPAGLLAAVAAVATVVGGQPAYADWTPVPTPLSANDAAEASRSCLAHQGEPVESATDVLIADRRGPWIYVLVQTSAQQETSCVMPEALVGTAPSSTDRRMYAGGSGEALVDPVAARQVDVAIRSASSTDEGLFMLIEGRVGSEVAGVTVLTPTGKRVTASVHQGRFAAWWPAGKNSPRNPELTGAPSLQVTMTDGTVVTMPG